MTRFNALLFVVLIFNFIGWRYFWKWFAKQADKSVNSDIPLTSHVDHSQSVSLSSRTPIRNVKNQFYAKRSHQISYILIGLMLVGMGFTDRSHIFIFGIAGLIISFGGVWLAINPVIRLFDSHMEMKANWAVRKSVFSYSDINQLLTASPKKIFLIVNDAGQQKRIWFPVTLLDESPRRTVIRIINSHLHKTPVEAKSI